MALLETLVDDFGNGVIDNPPWGNSFNGASETGGAVVLPTVAAYSGIETTTSDWSLTGSHVYAELIEVPDLGDGTTQALLVLQDSGQTAPVGSLRIGFDGGNMVGTYVTAGPTFTNAFSVAYSATAHRWVRILEDGAGSILFQTAPDGETWTTRGTITHGTGNDFPFDVDLLDVQLISGFFGTNGAVGQARWGAVNVANQSVQVDGVTIPVAIGTPVVAQDQLVDVDGVTIPVAIGVPEVAQDQLVDVDAVTIPVAIGVPTVAQDQLVDVDGVTLGVVLGVPTITFVLPPPPPTPAQPQGVQPGQLEWRELRLGEATPYVLAARPPVRGLLDRPGVRTADTQRLQRHGGLPGEDFLEPRTITLTIVVGGTDPADFRENYAVLKAALAVVGDEEPLAFRFLTVADGGERLVNARVRNSATTAIGLDWARVDIQWDATDPRIYATGPVTRLSKADSSSDGVTFPIIAPVVFGAVGETGRMIVRNNGNFPAPVEFIITGPCTRPAIRNTATGQVLEFDIQLGNGQILVINSDTRTVLLDGNTNAYTTLVTEGWFDISPGETSLHFTTATGTAATLRATFRSAWIT